ncbi:tripartite tricarboxylate transporter substrate binding protein [Marinobacter mangrovi]|uniref:tripartite tricarboxylate transporter substrate binding protein n=1 Tax=Marinobacter mangrovi TaxID=2803918 RepID=UPI001931E37D|nr:tripartite tricarboxylate transporter substrate binding protein [Marinobacter mangrovi]
MPIAKGLSFTPRLSAVGALLCALMMSLLPLSAHAEWPEKPLNLWVGFSAGGGADTLSRLVAKRLKEELGQPVVVRNLAGGGGVVMATTLKKVAADGYTFGLAPNSTFDAMPYVGDLDYKPTDFTYLTTVTQLQSGLVAKGDAPYSSWEEMVEYGHKHGLTFGATSPLTRKFVQRVARKEDLDIKVVPMKGGLAMINGILGGYIDIGWSAGIHQSFLGDGKLKVIAGLNEERLERSPNVPSITELGYDSGYTGYFLFAAPEGMPEAIKEKLSAALRKACQSKEVAELAEKRMGFPNVVLKQSRLQQFVLHNAETNKKNFNL